MGVLASGDFTESPLGPKVKLTDGHPIFERVYFYDVSDSRLALALEPTP